MTKSHKKASQVIEPASTKELAELVSELHSQGSPWVPCGLKSRINWGAPLLDNNQYVSVKRLNGIIHHSIDDLTITVSAGLPLKYLQDTLAKHNQWLPIDWPWGSQPSTQFKSAGSTGGLIARGLSGRLSQRYLSVRDQLIGISFLRCDGIAAKAGGKVVKNVAGYDLMRLLCGSWGSLALITELTLRTQPIRPSNAKLVIQGSLASLEKLRAELMYMNFTPDYFDWRGDNTKDWNLELGFSSVSSEAIEDQINNIQNLASQYQLSHKKPKWERSILKSDFPPNMLETNQWLLRICLPPSKIHLMLNSKELNSLNLWHWRFSAGKGVGDGWQNLESKDKNISSSSKVNEIRHLITSFGGQVSIINQPYFLSAKLPTWLDSNSAPLIKEIKRQFDPKNQLAVGRLPGVSQ